MSERRREGCLLVLVPAVPRAITASFPLLAESQKPEPSSLLRLEPAFFYGPRDAQQSSQFSEVLFTSALYASIVELPGPTFRMRQTSYAP